MANDVAGQSHVAGERDCMSSIAEQFGFFWKTLWFHGRNAALRQQRGDPNVLLAGDMVYIPPRMVKQVGCNTDALHTFVRKGVPAIIRLRFMKHDQPRSDVPYVLTIDGVQTRGSTDADGRLELSIPPNAQAGRLLLGVGVDQESYELDLGAIAPVSEEAGAISRLSSLGYHCAADPVSGLTVALRSFQATMQLPLTGELDGATQARLKEVFGC